VIGKLDYWLKDNIDSLYHLDNEELYLTIPFVRGHSDILK